jgi:hypothetical protein
MLREEDVEWVKQNRALRTEKLRKPMTRKERARYFRIRKRIKATLEGLTELIENIPEQQLQQTFSKKELRPLLVKLFSVNSGDSAEKRRRIIGLWDILFKFLIDRIYGYKLVGRDVMQVLMSDVPLTVRAIQYATMQK